MCCRIAFHFPVDAHLHLSELQPFCIAWGGLNLQLDSIKNQQRSHSFIPMGSIVIMVVVEGAVDKM